MKKIILALFITFSVGAQAQDYFWALTWDATLPVGETSEFIDDWSGRGIGIDNRWIYNETYSFGFYFAWHTMYEKKHLQEEKIGNTTLIGNQFRYINSFPIVLNAHYYFNPYDKISIYAGAGAGLYWLEARKEVGLIAVVDKGWRFGFYPEIGMHYKVNRTTKLLIAAKYHYVTGKDSGPEYTYLNVNLGMSWGFF